MTDEELNITAKEYKSGDKKAGDKMITANLKLVVFYAKKYKKIIQSSEIFELGDLISEGNYGLIQACEKYDPHLNIKFSYYASFWIKKQIQDFIITNQTIIRSPEQKLIADNKINKQIEIIFQTKQAEVTEQDIEDLNLFTPAEIDHYFNKATVKRVDETTNVVDKNDNSDLENDKRNRIIIAIQFLNKKEQQVMKLHFGFEDQIDLSIKEIAEVLNLTPTRVAQIKLSSISKIKELLKV
ncbi:sigma-70 family RNA polymerase sigma factor [Flavobacterium sp. LB3P21]|uniref:sigma-70 family RNA polymerase sigma factor n=1 Tax=Flavobacterium sp. LB3P21 TaxID=3401719 RepID=UPI003AAD5A13